MRSQSGLPRRRRFRGSRGAEESRGFTAVRSRKSMYIEAIQKAEIRVLMLRYLFRIDDEAARCAAQEVNVVPLGALDRSSALRRDMADRTDAAVDAFFGELKGHPDLDLKEAVHLIKDKETAGDESVEIWRAFVAVVLENDLLGWRGTLGPCPDCGQT